MAVLVLLARAARTRIIAAYLRLRACDRLDWLRCAWRDRYTITLAVIGWAWYIAEA